MANALAGEVFFLDNFAIRQWDDPEYQGTKLHCSKEEFVAKVHAFHAEGSPLVDGYAPFCKHVFVPNFAGVKLATVAVDDSNKHLIQTAYTSRRPEELAVLSRWIPADKVEKVEAQMLDVILYSREQIMKEHAAMPSKGSPDAIPDAPWGIISVKAQDESFETPMQPITIMRNALGADEGGSGVPLNKAAYDKSVEYWRNRVPLV